MIRVIRGIWCATAWPWEPDAFAFDGEWWRPLADHELPDRARAS